MRSVGTILLVFSAALAACSPDSNPTTATGSAAAGPTAEEALLIQQRCLEDRGRAVVETGGDPDDIKRRIADVEACMEEAYGPLVPQASTVSEIARRYEELLEAMGCIRALGYDVVDPPSLDSFIETYPKPGSIVFTEGDGQTYLNGEPYVPSWSPYNSVDPSSAATTSAEWDEILNVCPPPE
jgi:hypothetical protein